MEKMTLKNIFIYMIMVLLVIFKLELIPQNNIDKNLFIYFIFIFAILTILNLFNLLMLGDTGAYLISFFAGYLIITCHKLNPNISPYFFITLFIGVYLGKNSYNKKT